MKSAVQSANTVIFIPSSFDFIRVRNHIRKMGGVSFAVLSEWVQRLIFWDTLLIPDWTGTPPTRISHGHAKHFSLARSRSYSLANASIFSEGSSATGSAMYGDFLKFCLDIKLEGFVTSCFTHFPIIPSFTRSSWHSLSLTKVWNHLTWLARPWFVSTIGLSWKG